MATPTSPAVRVMPQQDAVRALLTSLFGRPVVVSRTPALVRSATDKFTVALFTHEDGTTGVAAFADLAFAAYAGAALTMFPTAMADQQISNGRVDEMVLENFREIMNVCASQFNGAVAEHVKLTSLLRLPIDKLPAEVDALAKKPGARLDFTVQIPNYGTGRLSFFAL